MARKQVAISDATAEDLAREASKHGVSRDKVLSKMLDFFRIYGIDPFNYDAPADEMQKIIKRMDSVVAFIKKQEKDILIPTLTRLSSKEDINSSTELLKTGVLNMGNIVIKSIKEENEQLKQQVQTMQELIKQLKDRDEENHKHYASEVIRISNANISRMLQEVTKTLGMGGQKKDVTLAELQNYER